MEDKKNKLALYFILLVVFVNYMGIGLIYPIFASLLFDTSLGFVSPGASNLYRGFLLGVLLALMPLMQFFFSPLLGKLSDQRGRKKILLLCLIVSSLGYLFSFYAVVAESLLALFIFRLLLGFGGASVAIVQALLVNLSIEKKAKHLSLFNMAMGAGYALGPFVGGFFSESNFLISGSFTLPFIFALVLTLINIYLVYRYLEEKEQPIFIKVAKTKISSLFSNGQIKNLLICMFIFSFGWSFFFEFLPIFLIKQFSYTPIQIGNFYGYSGIFYMLSSAFLIRPILERVKSQTLLFCSFILAGCYVLFLYSIENPSLLWAYTPLLISIIAIIFPTTSYLISNLSNVQRQGEALGGLIAIQSLAFALSPLCSGFLVGVHHTTPIFLAAFSFILSGLVYGFYNMRKEPIFPSESSTETVPVEESEKTNPDI